VIDEDPTPLPKKEAEPPPQFSAHVYCGQTARCIKMQLGMELRLSPGDFVLDGGPAPLLKRRAEPPPILGPFLLWPNGWMHQDATWYGGRPRPRRHCLRWDLAPSPQKRDTAPKFSVHVCCGETAVCVRIPPGTEMGFSLGDIALDGDPDTLP